MQHAVDECAEGGETRVPRQDVLDLCDAFLDVAILLVDEAQQPLVAGVALLQCSADLT